MLLCLPVIFENDRSADTFSSKSSPDRLALVFMLFCAASPYHPHRFPREGEAPPRGAPPQDLRESPARRGYNPTMDERITDLESRIAFQDHPYGRPVKGTKDSVAEVSADDLRDYVRRVFAREVRLRSWLRL